MRAFLSSTYADLIEYRKKAAEALEKLGCQVVRMETFGARPQEPQEACLQDIGYCDIFIGIYAYRYGFIPDRSEISVTEAEFDHARKLAKPVFCFWVNDNQPWLPSMIEGEPGRSKLAAFKSKVEASLVREIFTTPEDLALKIATSVSKHLNTLGLVSGLNGLAQQSANASEKDKQKINEALTAAIKIAFATLEYIAQKRRTGQQDYEKQESLSHGWADVGTKLLILGPPASELADRYFLKAQYWLEPELWTDERIEAAKIGLEGLSKESRTILSEMGFADTPGSSTGHPAQRKAGLP